MAARPEVAPGSSGRAEEGIGIARQTRPARPARARPVRRARVYASGLGYTGLRLNGRMVGGERERDPGYTSFDRRVHYVTHYVTHDVTSLLRQGRNAVGAILGGRPRLRRRGLEDVAWADPDERLRVTTRGRSR